MGSINLYFEFMVTLLLTTCIIIWKMVKLLWRKQKQIQPIMVVLMFYVVFYSRINGSKTNFLTLIDHQQTQNW